MTLISAFSDKTDGELVDLICQGNHDAFSEIVRRHTQRFFALAFRTLQHSSDAEDVVQACFIKLWQRPHLWQKDKSQFTTWFYRVVINACHDLQRSSLKQPASLEYSHIELSPVNIDSEELGIEKRQSENWRRECVELGIRALPMSQQDALNLVVYCELAQRDAAQILGISLKALEALLHRAKKNLAKHVERARLNARISSNQISRQYQR